MYAQEKIKPYKDSPDGKKAQVETMFNGIAHSYDRLNHMLSLGIDRRWRAKTIKALLPYQPRYILDIATGTGDFALQAYRVLRPKRISACDISEDMMKIGRNKVMRAGLEDIIMFQKEDSEQMTFENETFDTITVAFGVRNFEHLDKGLEEMHRVLQPGGHLAILELSVPKGFPMKQLFWLYAHLWMPLVGLIISKDKKAYTYLPASMEAFPQGEVLTGILNKAGFREVWFKRMTFGLCTMYMATK